jgi:hypothetical protein
MMCIFDFHTSKARYELKVVRLHYSKDIRGFIYILLADFFIDNCAKIILRAVQIL